MSDELNPYPGNMKRHRVEPLLSDEDVEIMASKEASNWSPLHRRDAADGASETIERVRDIYESARAKDAEEIAKWKGIVNGVRDALNHIGAEPPRNLDADLYYTVMALRGRGAEMVQMLVRYLFRAMAAISDGDSLDCWHALRDALAAAGYKRTSP